MKIPGFNAEASLHKNGRYSAVAAASGCEAGTAVYIAQLTFNKPELKDFAYRYCPPGWSWHVVLTIEKEFECFPEFCVGEGPLRQCHGGGCFWTGGWKTASRWVCSPNWAISG